MQLGDIAPARRPLSYREKDIIELIIRGMTNKEIASALEISSSTVKQRMRVLYLKLGVSNRTQLAVAVLRNRFIGG